MVELISVNFSVLFKSIKLRQAPSIELFSFLVFDRTQPPAPKPISHQHTLLSAFCCCCSCSDLPLDLLFPRGFQLLFTSRPCLSNPLNTTTMAAPQTASLSALPAKIALQIFKLGGDGARIIEVGLEDKSQPRFPIGEVKLVSQFAWGCSQFGLVLLLEDEEEEKKDIYLKSDEDIVFVPAPPLVSSFFSRFFH